MAGPPSVLTSPDTKETGATAATLTNAPVRWGAIATETPNARTSSAGTSAPASLVSVSIYHLTTITVLNGAYACRPTCVLFDSDAKTFYFYRTEQL